MVFRGSWIAALLVLAVIGGQSARADEPEALPPEPLDEVECPDEETLRSQFKPISEVRLRLHAEAKQLPADCSRVLFESTRPSNARSNAVRNVHWQPTNFLHQPLYFDDVPLERYGQTLSPCWQPVLSGARFYLTLPVIPWKMGYDHPYDCVTTLGLYRPGVCAPCMREKLPPRNPQSTLLETATVLGFVFLLP